MAARSKAIPGGTLKAQEQAEFSADFSVSSITYTEDGVELYHFDATKQQLPRQRRGSKLDLQGQHWPELILIR